MTPQVARIAATRLPHRPRPLRLSYAGQVLRVSGSQMRPERQIGQVGAELIGAAGPAADVEAIAVAGEALDRGRRAASSVDITLPTLVPAVAEAYGIAGERAAALRAALDHKDVAAVARVGGRGRRLAGRAGRGRRRRRRGARRARPARSARAGAHRARPARRGARRARGRDPGRSRSRSIRSRTAASSTTPASASRFSRASIRERGPLGELGRGGRYRPATRPRPSRRPASRSTPTRSCAPCRQPPPRRRVLVPLEADRAPRPRAARRGLDHGRGAAARPPTGAAEARRLGCGHVLDGGEPRRVPARALEQEAEHGQCRRRRRPMGRRGQGQDRRLAVGARRCRRALPGRPQCRPHAGRRQCRIQAEPAALRRGAARQAVDHRQRRRRRSLGAARRDRDDARQGARRSRPRT